MQTIDEARQRYRVCLDGSLHTMTALLPAVGIESLELIMKAVCLHRQSRARLVVQW